MLLFDTYPSPEMYPFRRPFTNSNGAVNAMSGTCLCSDPCPTNDVRNCATRRENPRTSVDIPVDTLPLTVGRVMSCELSLNFIPIFVNQFLTKVRTPSSFFVICTYPEGISAFPSAKNNPMKIPFSSLSSNCSGIWTSVRSA